jgi:hypothetical protein
MWITGSRSAVAGRTCPRTCSGFAGKSIAGRLPGTSECCGRRDDGSTEDAVIGAGVRGRPQPEIFVLAQVGKNLGLKIGTNGRGFLGGFLQLSDAESMNFHCVPNQVLYQAEPLPDL